MGAQERFRSIIAPNYQSVAKQVPDFGLAGGELLHALETAHEEAQRRIKVRFTRSMMAKQGFKKPKFGSAVYREYVRKGMITPEEQEADAIMREIRAERAGRGKRISTLGNLVSGESAPFTMHKNTPVRWGREAPIPSDQYSPNMATTAARDERFTPNAKALLQIIHARCASEGNYRDNQGDVGEHHEPLNADHSALYC